MINDKTSFMKILFDFTEILKEHNIFTINKYHTIKLNGINNRITLFLPQYLRNYERLIKNIELPMFCFSLQMTIGK